MTTSRYPHIEKLGLEVTEYYYRGSDKPFVNADDLEAILAKAPRVYGWGAMANYKAQQMRAALFGDVIVKEEMDKLRAELAEKDALLKQFETVRLMAGPEDSKEYIHNHEEVHKRLNGKT